MMRRRMILISVLMMSTLGTGSVSAQESPSPSPAAPICAQATPEALPSASHANDGQPDPAGRIVFGRLTRVEDIREQLVSLHAIDPDGSDLVPLLDCEVARPRFSPDGSRLAFGIAMDDGTMQVATMALDGSDLRVLTRTAGYADTPDWSPDGSWLVYSHSPSACVSSDWAICTQREGMHQSLWRMDADGSDQAPIGDPDMYDWEPRLSPDGREVVFTRIDPANDNWYTLTIRNLETGAERVVTPDDREPEHPQWSRDGRSIIYNTLHAAGDPNIGMEQIERVPANDAAAEPVVLYAPPGGGLGAAKPTYSPDGSRIAFGCSLALCLMDADGSNVTELHRVPSAELNHFAWGQVQ